jgi:HlyD family secretion protein
MAQIKKIRKPAIVVTLAFAIVAAVVVYIFSSGDEEQPSFRLERVERGPIFSKVLSTGTLKAVVTVQVGSQVSGQIKELLADFNSEVRAGQVIARIDPENFEARVRQADAELAVAVANVTIKRAAVDRSKAELENALAGLSAAKAQTEKAHVAVADAKRDVDRKKALHKNAIISESDIEKAIAIYDQALAQLNSIEADQRARYSLVNSRKAALKMAMGEVKHALAQVKQREAVLHQSKIDLEHTVIRSPVDGVVIERSVDIGQTVAASLQAPTLFTIAQDLRKMKVDTSMDEADVGRIHVGQIATFTVDAFSEKIFSGEVEQIRKAPQMVQNVVTYTVVVTAENPDLQLMPGMTANVQIVVDKRPNTIKVPNAALRFRPAEERTVQAKGLGDARLGGQDADRKLNRLVGALKMSEEQQSQVLAIYAEAREKIRKLRRQGVSTDEIRLAVQSMRKKSRNAILAVLTPEQSEKFKRLSAMRTARPVTRGRVWIIGQDRKPSPVGVITGISDGRFTELVKGDIKPGQQVIVGASPSHHRSSAGGRRFGF